MDPKKLAELRKLCEEATPGPWEHDPRHDGTGVYSRVSGVVTVARDISKSRGSVKDAAFIATARTALPELLDEVERLRGDLTEATCALGEFGDVSDTLTQRAIRAARAEGERDRLRAALRGLVEEYERYYSHGTTMPALVAAKAALGDADEEAVATLPDPTRCKR